MPFLVEDFYVGDEAEAEGVVRAGILSQNRVCHAPVNSEVPREGVAGDRVRRECRSTGKGGGCE